MPNIVPRNIQIPDAKGRERLLNHLAEGLPVAVAEDYARVDPGTTDYLIEISDLEQGTLQIQLACGEITEEELEEALSSNPIIVWALKAEEAKGTALKKAYENVNKSIREGNVTTSKWYITRHVLTAKDKALIELANAQTMNARLEILGRLRDHSPAAYKAALEHMGIASDEADVSVIITRINRDIKRPLRTPKK